MLALPVRKVLDGVSRVFFGLRFRLLLLVLLACAPLVALTLHVASAERRRAVAGLSAEGQKLVFLVQREESEWVRQTRQLLLAMSESSAMRSGSPKTRKQSLDEALASYNDYANLGLADTNGEVLATAVPLPAFNNPAEPNPSSRPCSAILCGCGLPSRFQ